MNVSPEAAKLLFQVATSNVLVDKIPKSEKAVIKEWLQNIFKTWEKTNDIDIKEFKVTQLKHENTFESGLLNSNLGLIRLNSSTNNQGSNHPQPDVESERLVS